MRLGTEHYDITRVRAAIARSSNWLQLVRFALVGLSGFVLNLVVFGLATHGLGFGYRTAAVVAFLLAVCNNYLLNRRWTFDGRADTAAFQLPRFLTISVAAFLLSFAVLEFGVAVVGLKELLAQAIAIVVATPVNFVGNKVWTFSVGRRHAA